MSRATRHKRPVHALLCGDSWTNLATHPKYPDTLPDWITVTNSGVAGQPIATVSGGNPLQSRLASELAAAPAADLVVICSAGINDTLYTSTTLEQMQAAIADITAQVKAANKWPIWCGIPTLAGYTAKNAQVIAQEAWMAEHCRQELAGFISLIDDFCEGGEIKAEYDRDGGHFNAAGAALLADKVVNEIHCSAWRKAAVA